jgi:HB1, ASXL, restriction endonuclease HTH domain
MKKADVKVGATYLVKVAGNLVPVKIDREHPSGGWEGTSQKSGKTIRIKSAQRLRKRLADAVTKPEKTTTEAKKTSGRDTGKRGAKGAKQERPSLLNLAAKVLAEAGEPMTCKEMVEKVLATGLWQTKGKTPSATLYSAILRECRNKGDAVRFRKVDKGRFAAAR